jgi:hypothetical protein
MDAFDYRDENPRPTFSLDLVWNILTVVVLLSIFCVVGYALLIFINPASGLNPFPPHEVTPRVYITPVFTPIPTATETKKGLPPTWTPEPTGTETPSPTPRPTATEFITETPAIPEGTFTPEPSLTPGGMSFELQGQIQHVSDFSNRGCQWMGVAGSVFDKRSNPVIGLVIQFGGVLDGRLLTTATNITGLFRAYGESGFEFTIADQPIASSGTLWVQLFDDAGLPLSNKIFFDTSDQCEENLVLIQIKQVK